jgi:Peptidase family M28/PDZ domain
MLRFRFRPLLLAAVAFTILSGRGASAADSKALSAALKSITVKGLKNHASTLAADFFEGREAGSRGGKAAGAYIVTQLQKYKQLRPAGDRKSFYQAFGNGYSNILAVLPGADAKLKNEYVVISAHYDHVGYGTEQNSNGPIGYIHNGADDNASGTASLLQIVAAFAGMDERPRRSLLFVFWDAEEKGLLGSLHWVRNPTIPLKQVRLVLNMDMVGRLRQGKVEVHGIRSGSGLRRFVCEHCLEPGLRFDFRWEIPEESDHYSFIHAFVPAMLLHTGKHSDYHRPSDKANKLNVPGMQTMSRLTFRLAYSAANADSLPTFRRRCFQEGESERRTWYAPMPDPPARLGLSWDSPRTMPGKPAKDTIQVVSVSASSPAAAAGLRPGDVITHFANTRVRNSTHFRQLVMAAVNPVAVTVSRPGVDKPLKLTVRLNGQARRVGISWSDDDAEPGVMVLRRVLSGSSGDVAGLRLRDRVYAIDGKRFRSSREFRDRLAEAKNGTKLTVERKGNIRVVELRFSTEAAAAKPPAASNR